MSKDGARPDGGAPPPDRAPAPADRRAGAKRAAGKADGKGDGKYPDGKHAGSKRAKRDRTAMLLRLDPALHEALTRWAADDLRSTNAHVEWLLRRALKDAGRLPE
ncbi:hypothetical protein OEB99_13940 [Actinotalea sp. M2MS4P-6]|uniref:hypothetical protein n=1 Tax=Actinotalea sp. M2MS4P-6 TaxID=2983762 RepID=UPI0021E4757A|nr:hypothetical protein [Actinotalea sp. M2MS4P-6]MCV2395413.1 hypothetical protein [Actinotalea sp. M2MS4P-6]